MFSGTAWHQLTQRHATPPSSPGRFFGTSVTGTRITNGAQPKKKDGTTPNRLAPAVLYFLALASAAAAAALPVRLPARDEDGWWWNITAKNYFWIKMKLCRLRFFRSRLGFLTHLRSSSSPAYHPPSVWLTKSKGGDVLRFSELGCCLFVSKQTSKTVEHLCRTPWDGCCSSR